MDINHTARLAVALLLAPVFAWADTAGFGDYSGGLNTYQAGFLLNDNQSPDLGNVLIDKSGGVSSRQGRVKINSTAIGGGSSDVNAVFELQQSDGDIYCVVFSSTSGFYSTDACQTFTSFVSTLTRNNDVNCDSYGDKLWCGNDQYNFEFDGTHEKAIAGAPSDLDFIRVWRNRCFGGGNDANASRLFWSALGNCASWNTSVDFVDVDAESGGVMTGLGQPLGDFLPIYKGGRLYILAFDNANTNNRKLINVSQDTGGLNHRATANYANKQYFASKGPNAGQAGIYVTDGIRVEEASRLLRNSLDLSANFRSTRGRQIIDTKEHWDAGTFDPLAMSSSRDKGFMQSSYTTVTDTLGVDFGSGSLVNITTAVAGQATLIALGSNTFINAGAETDATTNWESNGFTRVFGDNPYDAYGWSYTAANGCGLNFRFRLESADGEVLTDNYFTMNDGMENTEFIIDTSTLTSSRLKFIGSFFETAISTPFLRSERIKFSMRDSNASVGTCHIRWDISETGPYTTSGTITSRVFDMSISTPTWGLFAATISSNAQSGLTFQTQVATSATGAFDTAVTASSNTEIASAQKRFIRYVGNFTINSATNTPAAISDVTITAASTGVWKSTAQFLSNSMTGWGAFNCTQTTSGSEAKIDYCLQISTYSGGLASTACVTVTPGSAISASTGAYVVLIATYTIGVATETSKTDLCVMNWTEGAAANSPVLSVFGNRLHACFQSQTGVVNDTCYLMDRGGSWVKWNNMPVRHLATVQNQFVMASSTLSSGGFLYQLYNSDSDDGAAINAFWESKDYTMGGIQNVKSVDRLFLSHRTDGTSLTMTLKADGGLRQSAFTIDLSTGSAPNLEQTTIEPAMSGNFFRLRFENNAASAPWEIYSHGLLYRDLGLGQSP